MFARVALAILIVLSSAQAANPVHTDGLWIKDAQGRTLILRGVNLSGSSKVPYQPNGASWRKDSLAATTAVSFRNRPFPLDQADQHFRRMRQWGFTALRFLVTWEAVEHAGPGQYDQEYLDYLHAVLEKANQYGMVAFIDPHQDVWSRWTGGDGAPAWTLEAIGFDLSKLEETGAAITQQHTGEPFPRMIWPTNYGKYGAATMFSLFFAGDELAPKTKIGGVPIQQYLQDHYLNAMKAVAERLKDLPNIMGFDTLNEPGRGWLGVQDLSAPSSLALQIGPTPSPWQAIQAASGYTQTVSTHQLFQKVMGSAVLNPNRVRLFKSGFEDPWKVNGVWTDQDGTPRLLRPSHFAGVDFTQSLNHLQSRLIGTIRTVSPDALAFIEADPFAATATGKMQEQGIVFAGHWYDAATLLRKTFQPDDTVQLLTGEHIHGQQAVRDLFTAEIAAVKHAGDLLHAPTFIGEFGLPFDMNEKASYRTGDFTPQKLGFTDYLDSMDKLLLGFAIWNYTEDNTNAHGDQWNGEDLSIFSRDQQKDASDLNSGGRALQAIVRPYAVRTAGEPLSMSFDSATCEFRFRFRADPAVKAPTELFLPSLQYPQGYEASVSSGNVEERQDMALLSNAQGEVTVTIRPRVR